LTPQVEPAGDAAGAPPAPRLAPAARPAKAAPRPAKAPGLTKASSAPRTAPPADAAGAKPAPAAGAKAAPAAGAKAAPAAGAKAAPAAGAKPASAAGATPAAVPAAPRGHGNKRSRYKRREIGLAEGGKLILQPDGSISLVDGAGAASGAWAPGDPDWAGHAIRFGLQPQAETVAPHGRRAADPRPQVG